MHETGRRFTQRWSAIISENGLRSSAAEAVFVDLDAAYAHPDRHYHNKAHIESMLGLSASVADHIAEPALLDLAIYFHDAIYAATRTDNEVASADLARRSLSAIGFGDDAGRRVGELVLATRHDRIVQAGGGDAAWLVDIDLAILGAAPADYAAYAAAIRNEYAVYPDQLYRPGRKKVLTGLLSRPRLYATSYFHERLDAPARRNISAELVTL